MTSVPAFAEELTLRDAEGIDSVEGDARAAPNRGPARRVTVRFQPLRTASWDHRKLGGRY